VFVKSQTRTGAPTRHNFGCTRLRVFEWIKQWRFGEGGSRYVLHWVPF